jgi:UDP-glucose 4-epimerase
MRSVRDCNVAVIGGAGFLGSHLTDHLVEERNCDVLVVDNLSRGHRKYVHPRAAFEWFDLCGQESLADVLARHKTRFAFMTAAIPFVPDGFLRPLRTFEVTATAVLRVLNAVQVAGVEGTMVVSSAEIYGSTVSGAVSEDTPVCPHSTYAAAKQAADSLVRVRWHEAGVRALAARQFNSYGPRTLHALVLTTIIDQLWNGSLVRLGNDTTRDFQYCSDTVRIWVELLEKGEWGDVINCGSESSVRIYDLARLVGRLLGHESVIIETDPSRVRPKGVEVWHLHADCAKLHSLVGRRETTSLEEGVRRTLDWYGRNGGWDFGGRHGREGDERGLRGVGGRGLRAGLAPG